MTAAMFSVSLFPVCPVKALKMKSRALRRRKGESEEGEAARMKGKEGGTRGFMHRRRARVCVHAQKVIFFPCILRGFWPVSRVLRSRGGEQRREKQLRKKEKEGELEDSCIVGARVSVCTRKKSSFSRASDSDSGRRVRCEG